MTPEVPLKLVQKPCFGHSGNSTIHEEAWGLLTGNLEYAITLPGLDERSAHRFVARRARDTIRQSERFQAANTGFVAWRH